MGMRLEPLTTLAICGGVQASLAFVLGSALTMALVGWQGLQARGPRKQTLSAVVDALAGLVFALGVGLAGECTYSCEGG